MKMSEVFPPEDYPFTVKLSYRYCHKDGAESQD